MTTFKALTIAAALTLTASSALAMGCQHGKHSTQAQSCATGTAWDEATSTCIPTASSWVHKTVTKKGPN